MVPHARFIYQLASTSCFCHSYFEMLTINEGMHLCHKILFFAFCIVLYYVFILAVLRQLRLNLKKIFLKDQIILAPSHRCMTTHSQWYVLI